MKRLALFAMAMLPLAAITAQPADDEPIEAEVTLDTIVAESAPAFTPYYKYRVTLRDKKGCGYSLSRPEEFLSAKSIERRKRQGLKLNATDLPVTPAYVDAIRATGVKVLLTSKWNNTVLVQTENPVDVDKIAALPFVTETRKVATYTAPRKYDTSDRKAKVKQTIDADPSRFLSPYGNARTQIEQLKGMDLHQRGYRGKGMTIAVIDGGFYNADVIPAIKSIDILGTRDFVDPGCDIFAENQHGMNVLSCIGCDQPYYQIGTAPEASFWLLRSEDGDSEQPVETDYWASAVEFADSVGVDVINSSLGYTKFDDPADLIEYHHLDGKSYPNSRAASMLASKGIILCNSAGNEGSKTWKKIGIPADANDILAVGAVDWRGVNTVFSSIGNSADGRLKPDVCAQGGASGVVHTDGSLRYANGTSFSSPILTGMVACLWQALPHLNAYQIMDIIRRSGDQYDHPNNVFGNGIPDFMKAYQLGLESPL